MPPRSSRRFDLGSQTQPIVQFVVATLPFLAVLIWFLFETYRRPQSACYDEANYYADDDATRNSLEDACGGLIPLRQFLFIFLGALCCSVLLAFYLTLYIPRRHSLVEAYLKQGNVVIGDVYYSHSKFPFASLTATGHVVYPHPDDGTRQIRRKVYLYERYTRERAAVLYLPGQPLSGQPKMDLEIDRDVADLNKARLSILAKYAWAWVVFSLFAPLYILKVWEGLSNGEQEPEGVYQPDAAIGNFSSLYYVLSFVVVPFTCLFTMAIGWQWHKRSMTRAHQVLGEGEDAEPKSKGCFRFDDDDCETIEPADYKPPSPTRAEQRRGMV